jgi:hypothetical protein
MNKFLMDQPPRITEGKIHYYNRARTEASRSALIEVLRALESYSDHLVLVGGWAPYYILKRFSKHLDFQHCGSIDIDLVLDPTLCKPTCYKKILKILSEEIISNTQNGEGNSHTSSVKMWAPHSMDANTM